MHLILHIGTEKTGTTTLQRWLTENRAALKGQGVWYVQALGSPANRRLSLACQPPRGNDARYVQHGIADPEAHAQFAADTHAAFVRELQRAAKAGARHVVVSNEHLHSRFTSIEDVDRVRAFVGGGWSAITVLVHLRPQVDVAVSLASTATRAGAQVTRERFERIAADDPYFDYDALVGRWERVFGAEQVQCVPFRRQPDLTAQLSADLGLRTDDLAAPQVRNEALDVRTMALVNALRLPRFNADKSQNPNREIFIEDLPREQRLALGADLAERVQARFRPGNQALVGRRADVTADDLEPDWQRYQGPGNVDILDAECAFQAPLNALVQRFNGELKLERARTRLAEAERAQARNNPRNARTFLTKAQSLLQDAEKVADVAPAVAREQRRAKGLNARLGRRRRFWPFR